MIKKIVKEIKNIEYSEEQIRKFGILLMCIFLFYLFFKYLDFKNKMIWPIILLLVYVLLGLLKPKFLYFMYKIWMGLAIIIGFFISRFLYIILFFTLLLITALVLKILKKDLLGILSEDKKSFWLDCTKKNDIKQGLEQMF